MLCDIMGVGNNPLFMSGVIFKGDPRYFEQTSDAPYDRHTYRIVFTNGNTEDYPSWDVMRARWFAVSGMYLSHVGSY